MSLDLTLISATIPPVPQLEISRDNLISLIKDLFGTYRKTIVVQGSDGSGKTTLLSQFARADPEHTFSFFIGTTLLTSSPRLYLLDLCEQIGLVLNRNTDHLEQLDEEELKQIYHDFIRRIALLVKKTGQSYYFVIDGVELLGNDDRNLISLLPTDPLPGIYLLLTSEPNRPFTFPCHKLDILGFSLTETERYLADLGLSADEIHLVHKRSGGLPAYPSAVRRLLRDGMPFSELSTLPSEITGLFDLEWNRLKLEKKNTLQTLALLAFAKETLQLTALSKITDAPERELIELITTVPFLTLEPESNTVSFISEAHKQYSAERLKELKSEVERVFLNYYSQDPYSPSSLVLLPTYLAVADEYQQLKTLISNEYMSRALGTGRDISVLRRTLQLVANQTFRREDWPSLPQLVLSSSLLRTIALNPVGQDELEAVLSIGDYSSAFDIAYRSLLPADRLHLLALVCDRQQKDGVQIPNNVLDELRQMVEAVEFGSLRDRSLDIAAILFDLMPESAIKLVEKSQGVSAREKTLDLARALLALRLQTEATEMVRARITNPALRDFARAHSPRTSKMSPDAVVAETNNMKDTSGKLFLLTSWCNANTDNPSAPTIVAKALEVITENSNYTPSVRLLRQLAEPLLKASPQESEKLIQRLALIKSTLLTAPFEEGVRFDLLVAQLESQRDTELGINKLLEIYFELDTIEELDTQCYCITRVLVTLPKIDPADSQGLRSELLKQLELAFHRLLSSSADHFWTTHRTLRELAIYDPPLALKYAAALNTSSRRDRAIRAILWEHCGQQSQDVDFDIIDKLLSTISEDEKRELAMVSAIQRLAETGALTKPLGARLISRIQQFSDPQNKCIATAFAFKALAANGDDKRASELYRGLTHALMQVESEPDRVSLGYKLTSIVSEINPTLGKELFQRTRDQKSSSFLSDHSFFEVYINCLRLALRAFSGLAAYGQNYARARDELVQLIQLIPSINTQCRLLADLALRLVLSKKREDFEVIVRDHVLPSFQNCSTVSDQKETLQNISACLYEYDPQWALEQVSSLSRSNADAALASIVTYLVTNTLPDDPVEMDAFRVDLDAKAARTICNVISFINGDGSIYIAIEMLVEALLKRDPRNNHREVLKRITEREALDIARRLEEILSTKLPDPLGIQHEGYRIVCDSLILRLRSAAERRTKVQQVELTALVARARLIPNISDRIVVLAWTGENLYWTDQNIGFSSIREAEVLIATLPTAIDKADRFYRVAKSWNGVDRNDGARMLLQSAMTVLRSHSWDRSRDEISDQVLKLAYSIDPDFASTLTPLIDDLYQEHEAQANLSSLELQKNPNKVHVLSRSEDADELRHVLGKAAWKLLASLNSGMSQARHPREIAQWLNACLDGKFDDVFPVLAWSIQNNLLQTKQGNVFAMSYQGVFDSVKLCMELSELLLGIRTRTVSTMTLILPDDLLLFRAGQRAEALLTIQNWISENASDYLKIYDPYFSVADLEILKYVPPDVRVFIITSWKAQKGITPGDRLVDSAYRRAWTAISHHEPPWTQITITGTGSDGNSPLHSRYVVSKHSGLNLGTSLSGLGEKQTDIRILSHAETTKIEREFIDIELVPHCRLFKGEKLVVYPFLL